MKTVKHIDALDGIRAIAIFFVVWFHLWQQNWLTPYCNINLFIFKFLGITSIPLETLVRFGSLFVELLILLSAFCNLYPFLSAIVQGEKLPSTKDFYFKRAIRILPSYYLAVLVTFVISILSGNYAFYGVKFAIGDLINHLLFVSPFFKSFFFLTQIDVVLWTVQIEVFFYIIIPVIVRLFAKYPLVTYAAMSMLGATITEYFLVYKMNELRCYVNYPLTFLPVYANGLLFCTLYIKLSEIERDKYLSAISTVISLMSAFMIPGMFRIIDSTGEFSYGQLKYRFSLSLLFGVFIVSTCLASELYQRIFSNYLMRIICLISYNLYIWHQYIAFMMVKYHIPYYSGNDNPAYSGDKIWQYKYTGLAVVNFLVVAVILTFFYEIPIKNFFYKKYMLKKHKQINEQ